MQNYLPKILWLWIPTVAFAILVLFEIFLPTEVVVDCVSENGLYETLQAIIIFFGFLVCLAYFLSKDTTKNPMYLFWFGLAALCCLYVAGEEVSWGQHLFDWETPDHWSEVNDQNETNIHNTSSWFDQKPRLILIIGSVFGSLILPYLLSAGKLKLSPVLQSLVPAKELGVMGFLIIVPHITDKILDALDINFFVRFSEIQELYLFYFVTIYLLNLYIMLKNRQKS